MKRVELFDSKGRFKKGNPGGGGRPFGAKNKINVQLRQAIIEATNMVGFDGYGLEGLHGYLARLALKHPEVFGRLLEKLLPLQLTGRIEHTDSKYETLADLAEALKARGLPPPNKLIDINPRVRTKGSAEAIEHREAAE